MPASSGGSTRWRASGRKTARNMSCRRTRAFHAAASRAASKRGRSNSQYTWHPTPPSAWPSWRPYKVGELDVSDRKRLVAIGGARSRRRFGGAKAGRGVAARARKMRKQFGKRGDRRRGEQRGQGMALRQDGCGAPVAAMLSSPKAAGDAVAGTASASGRPSVAASSDRTRLSRSSDPAAGAAAAGGPGSGAGVASARGSAGGSGWGGSPSSIQWRSPIRG